MKKTIALLLLIAAPAWAAAPARPLASSAEVHAALMAMRYPLLGAGISGPSTRLSDPYVIGGDGTLNFTGNIAVSGSISGSVTVPDPIVPADGVQGITGGLVVDGATGNNSSISVGAPAEVGKILLTDGEVKLRASFDEDENAVEVTAIGVDIIARDIDGIETSPEIRLQIADGGGDVTVLSVTGTGTATGLPIVSTLATGTAPLTVASTTVVTNLNADLLDGSSAAAFQPVDSDLTIVAAIGSANQEIRVNAGATALEYFTPAASGIGGSTGAVDNAVLRADGSGGATLQDSVLTMGDTGAATLTIGGTAPSIVFTNTSNIEMNCNGNCTIVDTIEIGLSGTTYGTTGVAFLGAGGADAYVGRQSDTAGDSLILFANADSDAGNKYVIIGAGDDSVVGKLASFGDDLFNTPDEVAYIDETGTLYSVGAVGIGGAANGIEIDYSTAITTATDTTPVSVTGISLAIEANDVYAVICVGSVYTANTASGPQLGLDLPASATQAATCHQAQTAATMAAGNFTADDGSCGASFTAGLATPGVPFTLNSIVTNSTNAGNIILRIRSENTDDVAVAAGARCEAKKVVNN